MTQTILKRVQATFKAAGLTNCTIKSDYIDKQEVGNNNWLYAYQVNIPLCNFFNKQDNYDRWNVELKLERAMKLCKKRIDPTIAECSIIHTYHRQARYEIEMANGSYAWLKICYKHKPVERVGVPEQMQLFKAEDYVCK